MTYLISKSNKFGMEVWLVKLSGSSVVHTFMSEGGARTFALSRKV